PPPPPPTLHDALPIYGGDGSNTVRAWTESDMTTLQPIEAVEHLYPVRIERTALREDSGGPGRWRGGLGLTREVRIQTTGAQLSRSEEHTSEIQSPDHL